MSYPHRPAAPFAAVSAPKRLHNIARGTAPGAAPLTRRYETSWLTRTGEVETSERLAPATPLFEEAFSALARGAVVQTEDGPVAVEDLRPGLRALTTDGPRTITWIGTMTLYPEADPSEAVLTRITAEAFGPGRPAADLVLGPHARLCLRDARLRARTGLPAAFAPVRAFVDGDGVVALCPATPVSVYQLALDRQAALRVSGLEVESYHPGEGIAQILEPRLLSLFAGLFPHLARLEEFGPQALPRLTRFETEDLLA